MKINVKFKHQSETQYIEGTKREDCLIYALKCAMNFICESDEINTQVQKTGSCTKIVHVPILIKQGQKVSIFHKC